MAKVAGKDKHLADVVSMLEKGLERKHICEKMRKDAKVNPATTDRLIKEAKEVISKRNEEKEAIRQATMSKDYAEAVKEQIISDTEIEAILCKIVTGQMEVEDVIQGTPILRSVTPNEVINAAKTLFAKRGSNAPTKVADVNPDGSAKVDPLAELIKKGGKLIIGGK